MIRTLTAVEIALIGGGVGTFLYTQKMVIDGVPSECIQQFYERHKDATEIPPFSGPDIYNSCQTSKPRCSTIETEWSLVKIELIK